MVSSTLQMQFLAITATQLEGLIEHYCEQLGEYAAFDIPDDLLIGVSDEEDYVLTGYRWRYASPPVVEDLPCGIYNVEVAIVSQVPQGIFTPQTSWTAVATWLPGYAVGLSPGSAFAPGVQLQVSTSWQQIDPDGFALGAAFAVTTIWEPGEATGGAENASGIVLFTGNGTARTISGVGFEPGIVWFKQRASGNGHWVFDHVRGATKYWRTDFGSGEATNAQTLTGFTSNGFTLGTATQTNQNSQTYVAWCWPKGDPAASNTDGSITTTVSLNANAGFSIGTFTGTGANASIGHGLGAIPEIIIIAPLSGFDARVGGSLVEDNRNMNLATNAARSGTDTTRFQSFTSTLANIGSFTLPNGTNYVFYAFRSIAGTTKLGTYTGTGAADQTITTDFAPALVIIKARSTTGSWLMYDKVRGTDKLLVADDQAAEVTNSPVRIEFGSTGFTVKANENTNTSSVTYIYMAFR